MIKIHNETYDFTFWVQFGRHQDFLDAYDEKYPKNKKDMSWIASCGGCVASDDGQAEICIYIRKKNDLNSIAHEALHAVVWCLKQRSDISAMDDGGEETTAYMMGWLVKEIWKARKK